MEDKRPSDTHPRDAVRAISESINDLVGFLEARGCAGEALRVRLMGTLFQMALHEVFPGQGTNVRPL